MARTNVSNRVWDATNPAHKKIKHPFWDVSSDRIRSCARSLVAMAMSRAARSRMNTTLSSRSFLPENHSFISPRGALLASLRTDQTSVQTAFHDPEPDSAGMNWSPSDARLHENRLLWLDVPVLLRQCQRCRLRPDHDTSRETRSAPAARLARCRQPSPSDPFSATPHAPVLQNDQTRATRQYLPPV